jgi:hypothetical protein
LDHSNGATATLFAEVEDLGNQALEILWSVDGIIYQTNSVPAGRLVTWSNVAFTTALAPGDHVVTISASNGQTTPAVCSTTVMVTVPDATPLEVVKVLANPAVLLPVNALMKTVSFTVAARTSAIQPTSRIVAVTSDDPTVSPARDWKILDALTVKLRAKRARKHAARAYAIAIESRGEAGSCSTNWVSVTVPPHPRRRLR